MSVVIDNYNSGNASTSASLVASNRGQTFTGDGRTIDSATLFLKKTGSPTGNLVLKIYAHTGTFGESGVPTGLRLCSSDPVDVSTIPTDNTNINFTFSGDDRIVLEKGVRYCIATDKAGVTQNLSNNVVFNLDNTSPSHSGNYIYSLGSSWVADNTSDAIFYIFGTGTRFPLPAFRRPT